MSIKKDFQDFLFRGNLVDLAVGVIIGASFGAIVTALVDDLVMPLVSTFIPGGAWRDYVYEPVTNMKFKLGHFAGSVIDFLIKATVIFFVLVKFVGGLKKKAPPPPVVETKTCGECLETIPKAARRCRACTSAVAALALLLLLPLSARAQDAAPAFKFEKPATDPSAVVERKLQVRGGALFLGGNSTVMQTTLGSQGAYQQGSDRFSGEANAAYARTGVLSAVDGNGDGTLDSVARVKQTSSKLYQAKARYDRFFTLNNAAYVSAQALSDVPAGKEIVAGGQVGYSRQLFKTDVNRTVVEAGYDFSFEKAAAPDAAGVPVHSLRLFALEELKLSGDTGAYLNIEMLTNLNREKAPAAGFNQVDAFADTRIQSKLGLTTKLWKNVAFAFGVGLRYDQAPAPLKRPANLPDAVVFQGTAEKLDTLLEASLVVTFL